MRGTRSRKVPMVKMKYELRGASSRYKMRQMGRAMVAPMA
jgi:hypothetical protein